MKDLFSTPADESGSVSDKNDSRGPKASPRALAAWESLFENLPSAQEAAAGASPELPVDADSDAEGTAAVARELDAGESVEPAPESPGVDEAVSAYAVPESAASELPLEPESPERESAAIVVPEAAPAIEATPSTPSAAALDRPSSPFHVYEWVLEKLRARPSTTYVELTRLGERGNFSVAEGHYKRARREVDGQISNLSAPQVDSLIEDTLALIRGPIEDVRKLRAAASEIAQICDDYLSGDHLEVHGKDAVDEHVEESTEPRAQGASEVG